MIKRFAGAAQKRAIETLRHNGFGAPLKKFSPSVIRPQNI